MLNMAKDHVNTLVSLTQDFPISTARGVACARGYEQVLLAS